MNRKLLFVFAMLVIAIMMVISPVRFTNKVTATSPVHLIPNPAPALAKSDDRSQHCGTKEVDETVAVEIQSSLDRFNESRGKGQIRKSGSVTVPVYFHVVNKGSGVENGDV